jgi:hypothetical protein
VCTSECRSELSACVYKQRAVKKLGQYPSYVAIHGLFFALCVSIVSHLPAATLVSRCTTTIGSKEPTKYSLSLSSLSLSPLSLQCASLSRYLVHPCTGLTKPHSNDCLEAAPSTTHGQVYCSWLSSTSFIGRASLISPPLCTAIRSRRRSARGGYEISVHDVRLLGAAVL